MALQRLMAMVFYNEFDLTAASYLPAGVVDERDVISLSLAAEGGLKLPGVRRL
jgi:hypothetical protein